MNRFGSFFNPLMWFMALLLAAFVAGCGGAEGGSAATTPTAPTAPGPGPGAGPGGFGPAPVLLGAAGTFAILTKAAITDVSPSIISGDVGATPISGTAIGVTCAEVNAVVPGTIFDNDGGYTGGGAPDVTCRVTDAPSLDAARVAMEAAFTDAAGRTAGVGPFLNLGGGTLAGLTLVPGVYTWGSNVTIPTDLTLSGGANDVWIFQITGTLDIATGKKVLLSGGALAKNIFWQVAGVVTLQAGSQFEGIILAQTNIAMVTGASANSRLLAQTAVTLQQNTVTQPAP